MTYRRPSRPLLSLLLVVAALVSMAGLAPWAPGASAEATEYTSPTDPTVRYWVPSSVDVGAPLVIRGTGWVKPGGGGSVIAVLLDAAVSGDPNTVLTTRDVVNPATGQVWGDKRLHVIVQADAAGNWTAEVPFPTSANSSAGVTTPEWSAGGKHHVRMLTGTLAPGDQVRSLPAEITVTDPAPASTTTTAAPTTAPTTTVTTPSSTTIAPGSTTTTVAPTTTTTTVAPTWATEVASVATGTNTATAWVERDLAAGSDTSIRIRGTGWSDIADARGSTVAIKLNKGGGAQYSRTGDAIVQHPSAGGDDTIWALLSDVPSTHPNVHPIAADGSFSVEIDAPDLVAGQYLTVQFQSGRFLDGDRQRSVASSPLVIGGIPWVDDDGGGSDIVCTPTTAASTVQIHDPVVALGGAVRVSGTGWCHPDDGGSVVAFKIDEGAFSHLDSSLHQNRTIWAIVEADPHDGTFDATIELPDGTEATSVPAMQVGSHSLRLLSGTLKSGDTVRSVLSSDITVGEYLPSGTPRPPEVDEDLTESARNGVSIEQTPTELVVRVPGTVAGDWAFLTVFDGSSPRFPWGAQWFRVDDQGAVRAPLAGRALPTGTNKVAVHSDRRDAGGGRVLLGWSTISVVGEPLSPAPTTPAPQGAPSVDSVAEPSSATSAAGSLPAASGARRSGPVRSTGTGSARAGSARSDATSTDQAIAPAADAESTDPSTSPTPAPKRSSAASGGADSSESAAPAALSPAAAVSPGTDWNTVLLLVAAGVIVAGSGAAVVRHNRARAATRQGMT